MKKLIVFAVEGIILLGASYVAKKEMEKKEQQAYIEGYKAGHWDDSDDYVKNAEKCYKNYKKYNTKKA